MKLVEFMFEKDLIIDVFRKEIHNLIKNTRNETIVKEDIKIEDN